MDATPFPLNIPGGRLCQNAKLFRPYLTLYLLKIRGQEIYAHIHLFGFLIYNFISTSIPSFLSVNVHIFLNDCIRFLCAFTKWVILQGEITIKPPANRPVTARK